MGYITGEAAFEATVAGKEQFERVFGQEYRTKLHLPKGTAPRPTCACCGKPYGQRDTRERLEVVAAIPKPYAGNEHLVEERLYQWGSSFDEPRARLVRTTWDGESYIVPYEPFCTLRCALSFARGAHRAGHRRREPVKQG